mgnify:CR=1 FL=1
MNQIKNYVFREQKQPQKLDFRLLSCSKLDLYLINKVSNLASKVLI